MSRGREGGLSGRLSATLWLNERLSRGNYVNQVAGPLHLGDRESSYSRLSVKPSVDRPDTICEIGSLRITLGG